MTATATVPTHRVGKPFDGPGCRFTSGSLVDTSDWPPGRVRQLVEQRYLKSLTPHEIVRLTAPERSISQSK